MFVFGCRTDKLLNCFGDEGNERKKADAKIVNLDKYVDIYSIYSAGTYFYWWER